MFYYSELNTVMTKLGYDMETLLTVEAFQQQIEKKYFFGKIDLKK